MKTPEPNDISSISDIFLRARSFLPSGVGIVTAIDGDGTPTGFTASTLCAVSCEPALVSLSVAGDSAGLTALRAAGRFAISVLSESQAHLAKRFGTPGTPRFDDPSCYTTEAGAPIIAGATLHLICELQQMLPAGDHCLVVAAVRRLAMPGGKPLVYWRRAFFPLQLDYPFLESGNALYQFVQDWESGALHPTAWTHASHVAVRAHYAFHRSPEELFQTMKEGVIRFNGFAGISNGPDSGYHETLTRFWSNIISVFVHRGAFESPLEAARGAVESFGEDRDLHSLYYAFDVCRCRQARRQWIPPDRQPGVHWYEREP